jgi:hypothetical protein
LSLRPPHFVSKSPSVAAVTTRLFDYWYFFKDMARMIHLFDVVGGYKNRRLRSPRLVRERVHPLKLHDDVDIFARYRFWRTDIDYILAEIGGELQHASDRNSALNV